MPRWRLGCQNWEIWDIIFWLRNSRFLEHSCPMSGFTKILTGCHSNCKFPTWEIEVEGQSREGWQFFTIYFTGRFSLAGPALGKAGKWFFGNIYSFWNHSSSLPIPLPRGVILWSCYLRSNHCGPHLSWYVLDLVHFSFWPHFLSTSTCIISPSLWIFISAFPGSGTVIW